MKTYNVKYQEIPESLYFIEAIEVGQHHWLNKRVQQIKGQYKREKRRKQRNKQRNYKAK